MSRIFDLDVASQRRDRTSMKWRVYPDTLPLWVAEMDARVCQPVADAISAAMQRGDTGYPVYDEYRQTFADYVQHAWKLTIDPARVEVCADVMTGVVESLRKVTREGGPVVISSPVYNCFFSDIASIGRRVVESPLTEAGRLDFEALDATFATVRADGEPAAYLLCNPQNPTGVAHTKAELEQLRDLAARHGVRVVSDEIHAPLVFSPHEFVSYLSVDPTSVSVFSPSKGWNLAGLKSAVVASIEGPDAFPRLPQMTAESSSHLGVMAHTIALREGQDWLAQAKAELDENRRLLGQDLAAHLPEVGYRMPEATYLAWLDFRGLDLGDDPALTLRERCGVVLSRGENFAPAAGKGFARLNFATSPEIISEAIQRIAAVV